MNNVLKYKFFFFFSLATFGVSAQGFMPGFTTPKRLDMLNTDSEEIAPVPFPNGQKLYFVRTIEDGNALDRKAGQEIWTSKRVGDSWTEPERELNEANDLGNNGVIGTSSDGNRVYVFNSIQSRRKRAIGIAYLEKQEDGSWGKLRRLKIDGFKIGSGHYSFYMNTTEDVLLISMAPDKKTTNEDLFVSIKHKDGDWSKVESLGPIINTPGVELSPFITKEKDAIYFASNGHGGEGNVDIFISFRVGQGWNNWTNPQNLGSKINSEAFDGYFIVGKNDEVFFVSDRAAEGGDVYTTRLVDRRNVNGHFLYRGLGARNVTLEVYDELGNVIDTTVTDEFGRFSFKKTDPDAEYFLKVSKEDASRYTNGVFYEMDPDGNKSSRFVLMKTGRFVDENDVKGGETMVGTFTYDNLPLENAYLLVFDEKGVVVDTIMTDAAGDFIYKKLDANSNYTFKPLEIDESEDVFVDFVDPEEDLSGTFTYNSLPLQNEALLVVNEAGDVVDTVYTDNTGNFNYTKLSPDENYTFKPANIDDDALTFDFITDQPDKNAIEGTLKYKKLILRNTPLIVKDQNGRIADTIYTNAEGKFKFNKLKTDADYSFEVLSIESDSSLISSTLSEIETEEVRGMFEYKSLPLENEAMIVYDDTGFPIDTIFTDENGKFQYEKLKGEMDYTMKPLNEDDINFDDLIMTLSSNSGTADLEKVQGIFRYKRTPLKNEGLIVMDENGFSVDTVFTDGNGKFQYQKLKGDADYSMKPLDEEKINLDDLIMTIFTDGELAKSDQIKGNLKYQNKAMPNEALLVLNDEGLPVDTIYTDQDGKFLYNKKKGEENYTLKVLNDEGKEVVDLYMELELMDKIQRKELVEGELNYRNEPMRNEALVVTNERGVVIDTIYTDAKGKFSYEKIEGENNNTVKLLNNEDIDLEDFKMVVGTTNEMAKMEQVEGELKYENAPIKSEALVVLDEKGLPIDTIYTDANGKFKYMMPMGANNYKVKLLDEKGFDAEALSMVVKTGDIEALKYDKEKGMMDKTHRKELVVGELKYDSAPIKSEALVVLDEKGLPIDTIYTDANGKFQYMMPVGANNYRVKLLNEKDVDAEALSMVVKTGDAEALKYDKKKSMDSKPSTTLTDTKQEEFPSTDAIYFDFNQVVLTADDYPILDQIVKNKEQIKQVVLEGHTDSIGSMDTNMAISRMRVESAVNYLVKRGVKPEIIKSVALGEKQPAQDNDTVEGRAKNRRVVYICK